MDEIELLRKIDEISLGIGVDVYPKGLIRLLSLLGVKARVSTVQSPMMNLVGLAAFAEENVDEGIQHVIGQYQQEKKPFGWIVGPTSQPTNLADHLLAKGFSKEESLNGMVLRNLQRSFATNPTIRVEQVSIADFDANISLLTQTFGPGADEDTF